MFYLAFSLGIIMCSFAIDSEESEAVFFLGMLDKFKNIYYPGYIGYLGITNDIYHYLIFK